MRRRALLSGLLIGGLAIFCRALGVMPMLDVPLGPEDDGEDQPEQPPSTEPSPPEPAPLEPDDEEEERPPTEPA